MKKRVHIVFAAALAAALVAAFALVGCSSGGSSAASTSTSVSSSSTSTSTASSSASSAASGEAVELQIFAANSLTKAMAEAQELYTQQNPNVTFKDTQYKSSGELNTMLEADPTAADIEITASKKTMDDAEEKGFIDPASRITMFNNDLVIVTKKDNDAINEVTLDDVAAGKYTVCVGDDSVPAGNYANQSLSTVGCFNDPDGKTGSESNGKANGTDAYAGTPLEGKVVTDSSVGNVCQHAASGDVDIAFVYSSDVKRFDEKSPVKVVGTVPANTHKNITYPGAICAQSKNAEAAKSFLNWCMTDKGAAEIWQKWGFELAA